MVGVQKLPNSASSKRFEAFLTLVSLNCVWWTARTEGHSHHAAQLPPIVHIYNAEQFQRHCSEFRELGRYYASIFEMRRSCCPRSIYARTPKRLALQHAHACRANIGPVKTYPASSQIVAAIAALNIGPIAAALSSLAPPLRLTTQRTQGCCSKQP